MDWFEAMIAGLADLLPKSGRVSHLADGRRVWVCAGADSFVETELADVPLARSRNMHMLTDAEFEAVSRAVQNIVAVLPRSESSIRNVLQRIDRNPRVTWQSVSSMIRLAVAESDWLG